MPPFFPLDPLPICGRYRNWTHEEVRKVLPKLRSMRSIENAWLDIERDCLVVRTSKTLRHKRKILRLAQVDIRISLNRNNVPTFKYVGGRVTAMFNAHPTMTGGRIGSDSFRFRCIGTHLVDYQKAHDKGVYDTVLVLVTMLQTIRSENEISSMGGLLFSVVLLAMGVYFISIYLTLGAIIIFGLL